MADATDLPEAKDPFEKMVAISIAVMAVFLSYISMKGDNGKTDSIVHTNEASNQWAFYQAKSLKEHMARNEADILKYLSNTPDSTKRQEELLAEAKRYEGEKEKIMANAKKEKADAEVGSNMNDRADLGGLFLQIAIVVASVSILSRQKFLWWASMILGLVGIAKFFFF
jgi:hypothetical protein